MTLALIALYLRCAYYTMGVTFFTLAIIYQIYVLGRRLLTDESDYQTLVVLRARRKRERLREIPEWPPLRPLRVCSILHVEEEAEPPTAPWTAAAVPTLVPWPPFEMEKSDED